MSRGTGKSVLFRAFFKKSGADSAAEVTINTASVQPLGSFDFFDPEVIEDPYPFYQSLVARAPVYQVPGTEVYLVSTWELIHQVLRNQADYSANLTGILITGEDGAPTVFDLTQFGGTVDAIANADEPFHAVHRRLVLPQLNSRKVAAMEEEVIAWARRGVTDLVAVGRGDCVGELANAIPVRVMARLIGLPVDDVEQLLGWAFSGGDILAGTTTLERMIKLGASTGEMRTYLQAHFEQRMQGNESREQGGLSEAGPDDVIGELVRGVCEGVVDADEAIAIMIVLVGAAGESTSSLVGRALRILAQQPSLQQRLREHPGLIEAFTEEVVRLESPFKGHYRVVLNETSLGDVTLPGNARVILLWAAANRDPAVFNSPDVLDLERKDKGDHLGFGHGIHFCIGARLARMEARIILGELLAQTDSFCLDESVPVRHVPSIFVRRLDQLHLRLKKSR